MELSEQFMKKWIFTFLVSSFLSNPAWASGLGCGSDELVLENNLAVELLNHQNISITTVVAVKTKQLDVSPVNISTRSFNSCTDRAWWVKGEVEVTFKDSGKLCQQSFLVETHTKDQRRFSAEPSTPAACR